MGSSSVRCDNLGPEFQNRLCGHARRVAVQVHGDSEAVRSARRLVAFPQLCTKRFHTSVHNDAKYFTVLSPHFDAPRSLCVFSYGTTWFCLDAASCLPVNYIALFYTEMGFNSADARSNKMVRLLRMLRLLKLLRLVRINRIVQRYEVSDHDPSADLNSRWHFPAEVVRSCHSVKCSMPLMNVAMPSMSEREMSHLRPHFNLS